MPGVLAILTGEDVAAAGLKSLGVALPFKRPDGSDFRPKIFADFAIPLLAIRARFV